MVAQHALGQQQPLAQLLALELSDEVPAGDEPGHGDFRPEEVVFNGVDPAGAGKLPVRLGTEAGEQRRGGLARGDGVGGGGAGLALVDPQRAPELHLQQAQHAHAVFQLAVVVIKLVRGQLPPGEQVELIAAPEHSAAKALQTLLPEGFHLVQHRRGLPGGVGAQGEEPFPVLCQTHGHDGAAGNARAHSHQILHGPLEGGPVVEAGTGHHLAVHLDARLREAPHDVHAAPGEAVAHHLYPQLRVGGVDGDVDGGDAQVDDALNLPGGEVGQGDVVAHEEAQALVVVLKVEGAAQALGHLVHKAEHAVVGAAVGVVHEVGLKAQAQLLALALADADGAPLAVRCLHQQGEAGVVGVEFVVQHVRNGLAVDLQQPLAAPQAQPMGGGAGVHGGNDGAHALEPSSLEKAVRLILPNSGAKVKSLSHRQTPLLVSDGQHHSAALASTFA